MSRAAAMIDHIRTQIESVRPAATVTDEERIISKLDTNELPLCMIFAPTWSSELIEHSQREETTSFAVAYVESFDWGGEPGKAQRSLIETAEAIVEELWDANAIDTEAAGYFARVTRWDIGKSQEKATRWALVMEVEFKTIDAVDSAFSLTERQE